MTIEKEKFVPAPAGNHAATPITVVTLGIQETYFGQKAQIGIASSANVGTI